MHRVGSTPLRRLAVLALFLAQAFLLTAPIWHHHDSGDDGACAVCVAVLAWRHCDVPGPAPAFVPADRVLAVISIADQVGSSALPARLAWARGPPAGAL